FGGLVGSLERKAAVLVIDVIGAHEGWPPACLVVNLVHEPQSSRAACIGELTGDQVLTLASTEALEIIEDRPGFGVGLRVGRFERVGRPTKYEVKSQQPVENRFHYGLDDNSAGHTFNRSD